MKKMLASQVVIVVNTLVVCAPKMFYVTPPPKAAPSPSLFGRCIRMTSIMSTATSASRTSSKLIKMGIGTGNMTNAEGLSRRVPRDLMVPLNPGVLSHRNPAMHPDAIHNPEAKHDHECK